MPDLPDGGPSTSHAIRMIYYPIAGPGSTVRDTCPVGENDGAAHPRYITSNASTTTYVEAEEAFLFPVTWITSV
jgi:hypothetical protein